MSSMSPFSSDSSGPASGDARSAPRELMTLPGVSRDIRRWRLVRIRLDGQWRNAMLTVWRRPPGGAVWVAHVCWGPEATLPPAWGWFLHTPALEPLPEPGENGPVADAVAVAPEAVGPSDPDGADRCWSLAWVRLGGAWRSAVVLERRRPPAPDLPWAVYARWGEDKAAGWLLADGTAVRPVAASSSTAVVR
ncbi:hypothetical protein ACIOJE_35015 [Kitasatospora sp. NPDC087861]|uniref:hypothetical protein n=1 Tax=Kitasatospora sp. NPDC087861 TaxID=3364070 RepID=UPI00382C278C